MIFGRLWLSLIMCFVSYVWHCPKWFAHHLFKSVWWWFTELSLCNSVGAARILREETRHLPPVMLSRLRNQHLFIWRLLPRAMAKNCIFSPQNSLLRPAPDFLSTLTPINLFLLCGRRERSKQTHTHSQFGNITSVEGHCTWCCWMPPFLRRHATCRMHAW